MTAQQNVMFAFGLLIFAIGAYLIFFEGAVIGVVLMALATTIFALSTAIGAQAKKKKDEADAG